MNLAAGCIAQRQSATLIAALKTRVADQSSDACQYFRIIAEGCAPLVSHTPFLPLSLFFSFLLSPFPSYSLAFSTLHAAFYPVNSLPLLPSCDSFLRFLYRRPCCFEFARKAKRVSRGKPSDVAQNRSLFLSISFFFKRPDDALMRLGLCGWTEAPDFTRDRRG